MIPCGEETRRGDRVRFLGGNLAQVQWGGGSDPRGVITVGQVLTVQDVDVHTWHTKLTFEEVSGRYNSVMFTRV